MLKEEASTERVVESFMLQQDCFRSFTLCKVSVTSERLIDNFEQDTINVMFQILAFFLDYCYPQHYQYWRAEREEAQQKEGKIIITNSPAF